MQMIPLGWVDSSCPYWWRTQSLLQRKEESLHTARFPLCGKGSTLTIVFKEDNVFAETMDIISPPISRANEPRGPCLTQATADCICCIWTFSFLASVKKLLAGAENHGLQPRDLQPKYQRGKKVSSWQPPDSRVGRARGTICCYGRCQIRGGKW